MPRNIHKQWCKYLFFVPRWRHGISQVSNPPSWYASYEYANKSARLHCIQFLIKYSELSIQLLIAVLRSNFILDVKKIENIVCLILFIWQWFYQALKMVICCVVGCTNKPDKDLPLRFYHIPRIRSKHGEDSLILSTERRKKWFSISKRSDINVNALHQIVCSVDFVSGKPAALFETSIYIIISGWNE